MDVPLVTHNVVTNGQDAQPGIPSGCSAPNGHYVGKAVVLTAVEFGWSDVEAHRAATEYDEQCHDLDWRFADTWDDMVEEAETWLNEHTTGGLWHWVDGDFRLDATEVCPDCGEQRFADPDVEDTACDAHLLDF